jgi:hypothetical protein
MSAMKTALQAGAHHIRVGVIGKLDGDLNLELAIVWKLSRACSGIAHNQWPSTFP